MRVNGRSVQNVWADYLNKPYFPTLFSMHSLPKLNAGDRVDLYLKNGAIYDGVEKRFTHFTGKLKISVGGKFVISHLPLIFRNVSLIHLVKQ